MNRFANQLASFVVAGVVISSALPAYAVPYASGVRNTTGNEWEFVLNEAADTVTINRDGGNAIVMNSLAAGRHTFDLEAFSTFDIQVARNAPAGWSEISERSNLFTHFFRATGVVVNTDPSDEFFGTVYVSHPWQTFTGDFHGFGSRTAGDGIHPMTADLIGVDLANSFAVVADPSDVTQAKAPGWTVDGSTSSSPWQIALDASNNLIASDWSDASGGFKYASPDLSTGGIVLEHEDGIRPLLLDTATNTHEIHGSIVSKPNVTGSVGVDLTIWGVDEDFDLDGETLDDALTGNSLWRWDVGSATAYDQPPTLEISSSALNVDEALWFDLNIGVAADAHYEAQFGKWYMTQSRTHGNESSLIIVTPDGVDGTTPTIDWASKQWSIDNELDGNVCGTGCDPMAGFDEGIQDIFRSIGSVTISPDGTKLFAHRAEQFNDASLDGDNPVLGESSNAPGSILVIPLDENGLPDLIVDNNGTPEDPSDDFISNVDSITIESQLGRHLRSPISMDAAGNIYITNNISELLQVFSPGGNTLAITTSDGTFSVQQVVGLVGDYNEDGVVDAGDYTVYRDHLGEMFELPNRDGANMGAVSIADYNSWVAHFGDSLNSGAGALGDNAVPEPAAWLLVYLAAACGLFMRRR